MKKFLSIASFALALTLCLALAAPAQSYNMGKVGQGNTVACNYHTAVIDTNGSLWTWGFNEAGQLGFEGGNAEGTALGHICQTTPVKVMDNVAAVSCGDVHTAAIKTDGSLWTWGGNAGGQLGNGTTTPMYSSISSPPAKVLDNAAAVSCGSEHTVAIKTDGSLWMWGVNDGSVKKTGFITTPVKVMDNVAAVSCGEGFTAAIKTDGSLWTWGTNTEGQVGNGSTTDWYTDAAPAKVLDNVAAVSCGVSHMAAIKTDGSLWMWGNNDSRALGFEGGNAKGIVGYDCQTTPVKVMDDVAAVSCGKVFTAAIKTDNSLWMWGFGSSGQLGDGSGRSQSSPVKVLDNVAAVSCGEAHTVAIKTDGSLWTWGFNRDGQLGYEGGTSIGRFGDYQQNVPKQVTGLTVKLPSSAHSASSSFLDVKTGDYFFEPVAWAVEKGVTVGTSASTFSPDATCTQGQILTFLWRAKGEPAPAASVSDTAYYAKAAQWAKEQGLTDDFSADADCTRAMVVTYLWKLAGSPQTGASAFTDVPADAPYAQAVAWAVAQGITNGTGNGSFSPDATCTRGQIVTFLYRALAQ